MPEHVTILDVAREAGVSFKTVSNVLNNTGSMKESTRRRVEKLSTSSAMLSMRPPALSVTEQPG